MTAFTGDGPVNRKLVEKRNADYGVAPRGKCATRAGAACAGVVFRQGAVRDVPCAALLHRQLDARSADRRFYAPRLVRDAMTTANGPTKMFPSRGIKDSPPYLHDGRLLTFSDTIEFFNLILETRLAADEKTDLEAFLPVLWAKPLCGGPPPPKFTPKVAQ
jgi:hypothetical protein